METNNINNISNNNNNVNKNEENNNTNINITNKKTGVEQDNKKNFFLTNESLVSERVNDLAIESKSTNHTSTDDDKHINETYEMQQLTLEKNNLMIQLNEVRKDRYDILTSLQKINENKQKQNTDKMSTPTKGLIAAGIVGGSAIAITGIRAALDKHFLETIKRDFLTTQKEFDARFNQKMYDFQNNKGDIKTIENDLAEAQKKLNELKADPNANSLDIVKAESKLLEAQKNLEINASGSYKIDKEIEQLDLKKAKARDLDKEIDKKQAEIQELKDTQENLTNKADIQKNKAEIIEKKNDIEEMTAKKDVLAKDVEKLDKLKEAKANFDEASQELKSAKTDLEQAKKLNNKSIEAKDNVILAEKRLHDANTNFAEASKDLQDACKSFDGNNVLQKVGKDVGKINDLHEAQNGASKLFMPLLIIGILALAAFSLYKTFKKTDQEEQDKESFKMLNKVDDMFGKIKNGKWNNDDLKDLISELHEFRYNNSLEAGQTHPLDNTIKALESASEFSNKFRLNKEQYNETLAKCIINFTQELKEGGQLSQQEKQTIRDIVNGKNGCFIENIFNPKNDIGKEVIENLMDRNKEGAKNAMLDIITQKIVPYLGKFKYKPEYNMKDHTCLNQNNNNHLKNITVEKAFGVDNYNKLSIHVAANERLH